jgi:hypothetical protein
MIETKAAVAVARGADTDDGNIAQVFDFAAGLQTAGRNALADQILEAGLDERAVAGIDEVNFVLVEIHARDVMPAGREARRGDTPHITHAKDGDFHDGKNWLNFEIILRANFPALPEDA